MQTTGDPGAQSRLDIKIAQRAKAMARAYVNAHHKGHSDNWIIELPADPAMSQHDVELAVLVRVEKRLERNIALVRLAISERRETPDLLTADETHRASAPVFV